MLYFHYYQKGNIKNVLERKTCAFFLSIKQVISQKKNLRIRSIFNYRMAVNSSEGKKKNFDVLSAGLSITSKTFTIITLPQCFPLYKQESTAISLMQSNQSQTATVLISFPIYFPTLSKS